MWRDFANWKIRIVENGTIRIKTCFPLAHLAASWPYYRKSFHNLATSSRLLFVSSPQHYLERHSLLIASQTHCNKALGCFLYCEVISIESIAMDLNSYNKPPELLLYQSAETELRLAFHSGISIINYIESTEPLYILVHVVSFVLCIVTNWDLSIFAQ